LLYTKHISGHILNIVCRHGHRICRDIQILEKIQRSATKIVHRLKHLCCKDRLNSLGLTMLFVRRKRGDLIETYKILTEKEKFEKEQFFELSNNGYFL